MFKITPLLQVQRGEQSVPPCIKTPHECCDVTLLLQVLPKKKSGCVAFQMLMTQLDHPYIEPCVAAA